MFKNWFNKKRADYMMDRIGVFLLRYTAVCLPFAVIVLFLKLIGVLVNVTWWQAFTPLLIYYAVFTVCIGIVALYSKYEERQLQQQIEHIQSEYEQSDKQ